MSRTFNSRRIVINTFGSFGDIHPYIPIALELKRRGHKPVIATLPYYREKIEGQGIEFFPVRPDLPAPAENPEMIRRAMDMKTGTEFIYKELLRPHFRDGYEDLKAAVKGADLLISHPITSAAPVVAAELKMAWASSVLAPASFFSAFDPPSTPMGPVVDKILRIHPRLASTMFQLVEAQLESWVEHVYALRSELGLPRGEHPVFRGQHSPFLVLALFSKVFAKPQPDWPPNTVVTGFPFFDKKTDEGLPGEIRKFLESGPPPVVFTLGSSAVWTSGDFFVESVKAMEQLGMRAILLVGDKSNLSIGELPANVVAFDYAPYGELLPHAALTIHQGGIGTTAQALRSGRPMMVVPFSHDQPDNARRARELGVARTIPRSKYRADRIVKELREMLANPAYEKNAEAVANVIHTENAEVTACDAIEQTFFS